MMVAAAVAYISDQTDSMTKIQSTNKNIRMLDRLLTFFDLSHFQPYISTY